MSGAGAGSGGTPDEVWQKFLTDSEDAIRASAPREPSARDRTPGWRPLPATPGPAETVGELWRPDDTEPEPAWRELDGRGRCRRVARVLVTAAAVVVALTVWSQLTSESQVPSGGPGDRLVERLEEAPATLPTAAPAPAAVPESVTAAVPESAAAGSTATVSASASTSASTSASATAWTVG
ncbi:hypothetical protein AB0G32_11350 [Streptomyces sp. NPDC023723]|uniref:hypothetical protein n=1 Tax=Streptomyces sp. NPDC023723 TaxID=3154323 RepID=UPI0033C220ED